MDHEEGIVKLRELMKNQRICMLTTMTDDGRHVSRPMAVQQTEFDGDIWLFTYDTSAMIQQIKRYPQVNVAFSDQGGKIWISVSGAAEQLNDRAKAEKLWNPLLKAWFTDGLETPGLTLLKINAESAEYWDSPGSNNALALFGTIKAAVTGKQPDAGDNQTINLA